MRRWILILSAGMLGLSAATVWASRAGLGIKTPLKTPLSVKEYSARAGMRGHGLLVGK